MPLFYLGAENRYRADSLTSINQLIEYTSSPQLSKRLETETFSQRWDALKEAHEIRLATIAQAAKPKDDGSFGTGHLCEVLRRIVPKDSIFAIEAVTNTAFVGDQIQATIPGSWINCGGGGLGWSGGGALGIKLATEAENGPGKGKFVVQIVGDGTFLFSVPGSVYWISQRYKIPILTIVLNNKGNLYKACCNYDLTDPIRLERTQKITIVGPSRFVLFPYKIAILYIYKGSEGRSCLKSLQTDHICLFLCPSS